MLPDGYRYLKDGEKILEDDIALFFRMQWRRMHKRYVGRYYLEHHPFYPPFIARKKEEE